MSAAPPPFKPLPELKWHQRLNVMNISLLVFLLAVLFSSPVLQGSGRQLDYLGNIWNFTRDYFPPDFSIFTQILVSLWETFQIAVMATFFATILSVPLAASGARTLAPTWLVVTARMTMNVIRTIPSLIWALIAVAIVGTNPLAGVIALTFYSLGYLGKFFSDAFESVDVNVAKGLRAIGADQVQAFQHGLWPHAKPLVWSYSLWMLEYNIRSAAIIGFVGAGGIGALLFFYLPYYDEKPKITAILICILVLVTFLDFLGEIVRKRITSQAAHNSSSN